MRTKIVFGYTEFLDLRRQWEALLLSSSNDNLFLNWEWADAWINVQNCKEKLFIVCIFDADNGLAGLAPLYFSEITLFSMIRLKTLRVLGDKDSGSEYPGFLAQKGLEGIVTQEIFKIILLNKDKWNCIWMPRCAGSDLSVKALQNVAQENKGVEFNSRPSHFSAFDLPSTYEEYLGSFTGKRRNSIRRIEKKIEGVGGIAINRCEKEEDLAYYLSELYKLHHARWEEKGQRGAFVKNPMLQNFYENFVPRALRKGWLRFTLLTHEGVGKAIQLGYVYNRCYYQIQEGFEPSFHENIGNYLRIKTIQNFISEGVKVYDFLGGITEHKRRWGALPNEGSDFFCWRRSLKTAPFALKEIWPSGRFIEEA